MAKKTTGRYRSWPAHEEFENSINSDDGGQKKKPKINDMHVTSNGTAPRHSYGRGPSYPMLPSSSISTGSSVINAAQFRPSSSQSAPIYGRKAVEEEGNGILFSSISSTGSVDAPMPMSMSIFSPPTPYSSSSSAMGRAAAIEIRDDHICGHIQQVTEDPDSIRMPSWESPTTIFFSVTKPSIPHEVFIKRLVRRAKISKRGFVHALMYLEKLRVKDVKLTLSPYNIHRLLVTALAVAGKHVQGKCWVKNLQEIVAVAEMDRLQSVMVSLLDYDLEISDEDYSRFVTKMTDT